MKLSKWIRVAWSTMRPIIWGMAWVVKPKSCIHEVIGSSQHDPDNRATVRAFPGSLVGWGNVTLYYGPSAYKNPRLVRVWRQGNRKSSLLCEFHIRSLQRTQRWSIDFGWEYGPIRFEIKSEEPLSSWISVYIERQSWFLMGWRWISYRSYLLPMVLRVLFQRVKSFNKEIEQAGAERVSLASDDDFSAMQSHYESRKRSGSYLIVVDGSGSVVGDLQNSLSSSLNQVVPLFKVAAVNSSREAAGDEVKVYPSLMAAVKDSDAEWIGVLKAGDQLSFSASYWIWEASQTTANALTSDVQLGSNNQQAMNVERYGVTEEDWVNAESRLPGLVMVRVSALKEGCLKCADHLLAGVRLWPALKILHIDQPLLIRPRRSLVINKVPKYSKTIKSSNLGLVSVLIPTRDQHKLLRQCIDSLLETTKESNIEIIIANNGSVEEESKCYLEELREAGATVLSCNWPFNYSKLVNALVDAARGEYVLLLNNDVKALHPGWLSSMVRIAQRMNVGCVGARLLYGNGRVQHAGVVTGLGSLAGHPMNGELNSTEIWAAANSRRRQVRAVTAACLLVRRKLFKEMGGFNEEKLHVAFNDVDFCLRIESLGYLNIWTPEATLIHHESISRGRDVSLKKAMRFFREAQYIRQHWWTNATEDQYFPRLFSRVDERCRVQVGRLEPRPWLTDIENSDLRKGVSRAHACV